MQTTPPRSATRRRYSRVQSLGEGFAQLGNGWGGSGIDLSLGGMLGRIKRVLTLGSSYFVKLLFPEQVVVVEARVVRVQSAAEDYLTGMEFVKLSSDDREALRGLTEPKTQRPCPPPPARSGNPGERFPRHMVRAAQVLASGRSGSYNDEFY